MTNLRPTVRPVHASTPPLDLGDLMPDWTADGQRLTVVIWDTKQWRQSRAVNHPRRAIHAAVMGCKAVWTYDGVTYAQTAITVLPRLGLAFVVGKAVGD